MLRQVARGASNREAAAALDISEATVKTHLLHIYAKLGVNDRAAAVAAGVRPRAADAEGPPLSYGAIALTGPPQPEPPVAVAPELDGGAPVAVEPDARPRRTGRRGPRRPRRGAA